MLRRIWRTFSPCKRAVAVAPWLLAATSCVGSIGHEGTTPEGDQSVGSTRVRSPGAQTPGSSGVSGTPGAGGGLASLACGDTQPGVPDPPLRRLTTSQYRNTVRDLITFALKDDKLASAALTALKPALESVAIETRPRVDEGDEHGTFRRLAQDIQQSWVEGIHDVAREAGAVLTRPESFARLVPCAATAGTSASSCVDTFIKSVGERALRAPLQDDQVALFRMAYGDTAKIEPAAFADLVVLLLTAPQFLYQMEHGQAPVSGRASVFRLSPYELAARLSYQFWDTMPDDALWAAARSGELLTADGYKRELDRVLSHPRARAVFDSFYTEWLRLDDQPALDDLAADKVFQAFAGVDLPKPALRTNMTAEMLELTRYFTWTKRGTFDDLLTTDLAFARTADVAKIYGLAAPWDGMGAPPSFSAGSRPGFLTRAALLANGEVRTRPVIRGFFLRSKILCDKLPPPPPNADEVAAQARVKLPANASTRQETTFLTEALPACAGCHGTMLNPLGFALEGFDALGRARQQEPIFAKATGAVVDRVAVDTRVVPRVTGDDMTAISTPRELVQIIQTSGKAHACFARGYARFTFGRAEDAVKDACLLDGLTKQLRQGSGLQEAFKLPALAPAFQERNFGAL